MTNQEQMARDLHVIASPIRAITGVLQFIAATVVGFVLLFGAIFYFLATGTSLLSPDELSMLTAGVKLLFITSVLWLPVAFLSSRKFGFWCFMALGMYFTFIQVSPHYVDHEFCLTMGQLSAMVLVPILVILLFKAPRFIKRLAARHDYNEIQMHLMRTEMVSRGLISKNANDMDVIRAFENWKLA